MTSSYDGRIELCLSEVKFRNSGIYTCIAINEIGQCESSSVVEIIGPDEEEKLPNEIKVSNVQNIP